MYHFLRKMFPSHSKVLSTAIHPQNNCNLINCFFNHSKRQISSSSELVSKRAKTETTSPVDLAINRISGNGNTESITDETPDISILSPKVLPGIGAPAKHQDRLRFIKTLVNEYTKAGSKRPKYDAVQGEFNVALKSNNNTYTFRAKSLLRAIRNGEETSDIINGDTEKKTRNSIANMTHARQFEAVVKLIHSKQKLKSNGYAISIPVREVDDVLSFEKKECNRCQTEFNFKDIAQENGCQYHERKKRRETTGIYWECCSELVGDSRGCKTSNYHVFKAVTQLERQELIPYTLTPHPITLDDSSRKNRIVGLDCEMGYTTKGLELIRLTVIDFYTGKTVFDEIVKPEGKVLDLNTQWSGVSEIPESTMTLSELHEMIFHTVLDRDTIIVGHGLENDLDALRLIHFNIVDTSILIPKGTYHKYSLKDLSFEILNRKIQSGEHSSEEDSLAAIDIVKAQISK